jgi:hypothetical protein
MDFLIVVLFMVVTISLASYYKFKRPDTESLLNLVLNINGLIFLALIWGIYLVVFGVDVAITMSLITYAIIGMISYVYGKNRGRGFIKVVGGMLICFTTLWMLAVLVDMGPVARIIGFVIIGAILLSSAFMLKKKN